MKSKFQHEFSIKALESATLQCGHYMKEKRYRGYDPYDTLKSPLFRLPLFNAPMIRFVAQQVGRRSLLNWRRVLRIRQGLNPVTIGLALQAYTYLAKVLPHERKSFMDEIDVLFEMLLALRSKGYSGICWGYDFDWEARFTKIPAYTPTSVVTGIITNALFELYRIHGDARALDVCVDAAQFIRNDINKTYDNSGFCYSYSPGDQQFVLNASMKAARLLAQVYSVCGDRALKSEATRAVSYVVSNQNPDGSWPYARHDPRTWSDNHHTGYILDCLDEFARCTGEDRFSDALVRGVRYYVGHFFDRASIPKYYNDGRYPVDSTAAAQSLLSLARFHHWALAMHVAGWCVRHMQAENGAFYYRVHRLYTDKTVYMRWSNAWMFAGLSYLLYSIEIHSNCKKNASNDKFHFTSPQQS